MESTRGVPQLSNEMQLSIMNKVKSGELSIDDALNQARQDNLVQLQQDLALEEQQASQYNFSVYKFNRYRWQKRVLQIDFKTKMICSIEKGIVKRQLPFTNVKNCPDGMGTKFSISFKGRHDYELEATSLQDKQKIMQLINKVINRNIYSHPVDASEEVYHAPLVPKSLHEGQLFLQRGGLVSIKWVKYEAHLHMGQLTLLPAGRRPVGDGDGLPPATLPVIIHFSDGNASVEKPRSCDTFTLLTYKNEYHFRVPVTQQQQSSDAIRCERDAWVRAIDKLCLDWKRKSQREHVYEDPRVPSSRDDASATATVVEIPPAERKDSDESPGGERTQSKPPCVPMPRSPGKSLAVVPVPVPRSAPAPESAPVPESVPSAPVVPPLPMAPLPPPLPRKRHSKPPSDRTKAFHWDVVAQDKIEKSVWTRGITGKIEIDTVLLYEQFGVKDLGNFGGGAAESSSHIHIMLNQKIAHNFNIFLKSFPVQPEELKDKLFVVNERDGGLSDEHIASLRRYVPTTDDIEMYTSYKGDVSELHVVDQYMREMCSIPFLSSRLDLLLTLRELPISMDDLQPLISQKIRMCLQLWGSKSFVSVLEYLLAVGNYLNVSAGKEKAKGFRLSSLAKLSQLRGKDRKFTLLHALVEQIGLHEPCLATFFHELAEFETVPGASIKGLTAEVDVVKNELQKVIQYRKQYKKRNPVSQQHPKFSKDLKTAIEKYEADLCQLTKRCEEMKKLYSDILVKFGEPLDQDSQELFGWVCQFVNEFKSTHSEFTL